LKDACCPSLQLKKEKKWCCGIWKNARGDSRGFGLGTAASPISREKTVHLDYNTLVEAMLEANPMYTV